MQFNEATARPLVGSEGNVIKRMQVSISGYQHGAWNEDTVFHFYFRCDGMTQNEHDAADQLAFSSLFNWQCIFALDTFSFQQKTKTK